MGKLIRLELFNFKSYKGHHVLQFGDSYFTSIIGPNGSGKSNSMDAISFVLGIKSSQLRSSHLKDLIYRGRVLKTSKLGIEDAPAGGAEAEAAEPAEEEEEQAAKLGSRHDPQTAWVMAVYEDDAGEEHLWKRSITASGASEYRINGKAVSAKQYNDTLESHDILIKARNFLVFQGDVEAIANQNPRELTRLIEQISGSGEYRADYERLKIEAEQAGEKQAYMLQQRRGINQEIKQYQDQKRETEAFNAKQAERDSVMIDHLVWKLFNFQVTLDRVRPEMQQRKDEIKEHRRQTAALDSALEMARRQQAESNKLLADAEREIKRADRRILEGENNLVPIREKILNSRRNLDSHRTTLDDLKRDRDLQRAILDKLQKEIGSVNKAQAQWERQWAQERSSQAMALSKTDLQEYNGLRHIAGSRAAIAQARVDALSNELELAKEQSGTGVGQITRLRSRLEKLESDLVGLDNSRTRALKRQSQAETELETKTQTLRDLDADRIRISHARTELDEKLQDVLRKLSEADSGRRETEREARLKDTIASLKRVYPGVKGRVSDLCRPKQRRFDIAVATVLGRHLDSVVVDSEKTAKECISYLREQRAGQATFIPLDTITVSSGNSAVKGLVDGVRLAIDTIEFDHAVERAMLYVTADAVVCNDLQTATDIRFNRRIDVKAVTLDGTVIHRAGLMTGGRANDGPSRRRWDAAEVDSLHKVREKLTAELAALPTRPTAGDGDDDGERLKIDVARLGQLIDFARDEVGTLDRNISSSQREIAHLRQQIEQLTPTVVAAEAEVGAKQAEVEAAQAEVAAVEDSVFASFCARLGFPNIRTYDEQQGAAQQRATDQRLRFESHLTQLTSRLEYEKSGMDGRQSRVGKMESLVEADGTALDAAESELATAEQTVAALVSRRDGELAAAVDRARQTHEKRSQTVVRRRADVAEAASAADESIKAVEALEAEGRRVAAARYGLLRKCQIDEVNLPLTKQSRPLAKLPLEEVLTTTDESQQRSNDEMDVDRDDGDDDDENADGETAKDPLDDYGIDVDFSGLDDDIRRDDPEIETRFVDQTAALTAELDRMAPNTRATSRLDEVEARLSRTERDFEAARRSARMAREEFEEVKSQRLQLFNRAFSHISDQIGPVYKELTKSVAFPLGGQAYLDSEDADEPYLAGLKYHAMPPLKRFRDMEHLSGGEKTMAALALLFSIHSFQPSPFFVLDEVDAALDNANVGKIARYISEHAGPGMQFIVISLKLGLFCQSETLVGIMRDQGRNSSAALTLDLRKYGVEGGQRDVAGVVTGFSGL